MKAVDILQDSAILSNIPKTTLQSLSEMQMKQICHSLLESIENDDDEFKVYLGYGALTIKIVGDEVHYRFEPSETMQRFVLKTIQTRESPIVTALEERLSSQIISAYKDLI